MFSKWSPSRHFRASGIAFVTALILLAVSAGVFERQKTLAEFTLEPDQYGAAITLPDSFEVPADLSHLIIMYDAPVDQSWVFIECQLLRRSQMVAAEFTIQLEHYYGRLHGRPWTIGSQTDSRTVPTPGAGRYFLRVKAAAGNGAETLADQRHSGPPVRVRIQSGMQTVRLMTWATTGSALLGVALLLHGLTPPERQPSCGSGELKQEPKPRFLFLDGLRGVAVMAVLTCHFFVPELSSTAPYLELALSKWVGGIARHGDLGVEIFFVLSGFVIAHSLGDHAVTPRFAARFIARRAVRLDPPYYMTLGLMLMIVAANRHDGLLGAWRTYGGWSGALSNLFYLQVLLHQRTPLDISWTLCLEIQFYLTLVTFRMIITFLAGFQGDLSRPPANWLLLLVLPLVLVSLACWYPAGNRFDFLGTWFRFGLGVITYLTFRGSIGRVWWIVPMALIVGLSAWFHDLRGIVAAVTAGLILFTGISGRLGTWLSNRPIQFFGKHSYSIYLVHLAAGVSVSNFIWEFVEPTPVHALLVMAMGLVTSIGGALLVYHLFEKPGIAISHRLK